MKFLILINATAQGRAMFKDMGVERAHAATAGYRQLNADLAVSGEKIASAALDDPSTGVGVAVVDGTIHTTDGPFAEAKEFLAGFFLLECDSLQQAVEHAAKLPEAQWGMVEVRPVRDLSFLGL
ncbi:MAG: YciI family protein [Jatrophihabitans sp.]